MAVNSIQSPCTADKCIHRTL